MAAITMTCPDCSAPTSLGVGQSFVPGHLVWYESFHCNACGRATEADGDGVPPTTIRDAIINSEGYWGLHVDLVGPERLSVCKILRCDLNSDICDVPAMKNRLPGIVFGGTRAEMDWLSSRLAAFGYKSTVVEADRGALPDSIDYSKGRCTEG